MKVSFDVAFFFLSKEVQGLMSIGRKSAVSLFKNYIVVVSPPALETKGIRSALPNILSPRPDAVEQSKISIIDTENKFIVHTGSVPGGVKEVFSSWGNLYLISTDGEVGPYFRIKGILIVRSTNLPRKIC